MIGKFKCEKCKNFISGEIMPNTWKCHAYPNGIPEIKIAYLSKDPCINCNNGIGFEPEEQNNTNRPQKWAVKLADKSESV